MVNLIIPLQLVRKLFGAHVIRSLQYGSCLRAPIKLSPEDGSDHMVHLILFFFKDDIKWSKWYGQDNIKRLEI